DGSRNWQPGRCRPGRPSLGISRPCIVNLMVLKEEPRFYIYLYRKQNKMISDRKQELIAACSRYVEERIDRIRKAIADQEDALKLETKCSMGDKYETGRAMLHLEFEKLSGQMEQYGQLKKTISLLDRTPVSEV